MTNIWHCNRACLCYMYSLHSTVLLVSWRGRKWLYPGLTVTPSFCKKQFSCHFSALYCLLSLNRLQKMSNDWSNTLCSCFEDITTCKFAFELTSNLLICYLTCFFALQASSHGLCHSTPSARMRNSLARAVFSTPCPSLSPSCACGAEPPFEARSGSRKGIEGTCIMDLLMVLFCYPCSLVQEARVSVWCFMFCAAVICVFLLTCRN